MVIDQSHWGDFFIFDQSHWGDFWLLISPIGELLVIDQRFLAKDKKFQRLEMKQRRKIAIIHMLTSAADKKG